MEYAEITYLCLMFEFLNEEYSFAELFSGKKTAFLKGGKILLAPNGKKSNLNAEQYKLVRTKEFKKWFGDWENDSKNASKVVDENGEPLVVYHGGADVITEFDERYAGATTANNEYGAFFFSNEKGVAIDYSKQSIIRRYDGRDEDELSKYYQELSPTDIEDVLNDLDLFADDNIKVVSAFLDIRDLYIDNSYKGGLLDTLKLQRQIGYVKNGIDENYEFADDDIHYNQDDIDSYENEIKQRAIELHSLDEDEEIQEWQLQEATQEILEENGITPELKKYDGLLVKDVVDDIGEGSRVIQDEYIALEPNQIKLADGSNKTFDINNPDIRYEKGGLLYGKKSQIQKRINMEYEGGDSVPELQVWSNNDDFDFAELRITDKEGYLDWSVLENQLNELIKKGAVKIELKHPHPSYEFDNYTIWEKK